jgi:riboflavin kinase/FMN adenylyltransferase
MKVYDISEKPYIIKPVVTIGIFDGVHSGHKYILSSLMKKAREVKGKSVVVTLWPHPRIVLQKDLWNFKLLHSQQEKVYHLSRLGLDYMVTIPFTPEIASMDACDFVRKYLVEYLRTTHLILGYDNVFGKDRKGDPDGLTDCSGKYNFTIEKLEQMAIGDFSISSSSIRKSLLDGDLAAARKMLDYDYYLAGTVIQGNQLGRTLGYATANILPQTAYKLIPKDGVYAVHIEYQNQWLPAMLNIGVRPTLDSANPVKTIEAHILDFEENLYDKEIIIHFRKRLRDEVRFPTFQELKKQLQADEQRVREFFKM